MTDEAIDNLTTDQLDDAIAEAMEPLPTGSPYDHESAWWSWDYMDSILKHGWHPSRSLRADGGNIAEALIDKLAEWGHPVQVHDRGIDSVPPDQRFIASLWMHGIYVAGPTFSIVVARMFLRAVAAKMEVAR